MKSSTLNRMGYITGVTGVALALVWIGIFKFTPTEANAIKSLVENHFAMSWLYSVLSVQGVSNLIGVIEIVVGIMLLLSLAFSFFTKYAGIGSSVIFITTLSFLFTTPGVWKIIDGVPITNFFVLKDIPFLAVSILVWARGVKTVGE